MTSSTSRLAQPAVPAHVPPELVIPFDFLSDPQYKTNPFAVLSRTQQGPRIFFTPVHYQKPGSWVLTHAEDIRYVWQNPELFSSVGCVNFNSIVNETWILTPLEMDPPQHTAFRRLLNPFLAPARVTALEETIRKTALGLIDEFAARGECSFVSEFAHPFPVSIFLSLMGLPSESLEQFVKWVKGTTDADPDVARASVRSISDYMRAEISRRQKAPTDDFISRVIKFEVDGRTLTFDEILGICFLLFLGGLDTVTASLGFHYNFLAQHPQEQHRLRDDRSLIPAAVEELLRLFAVVQVQRCATRDIEIGGVMIKQGDWVTLVPGNANTDAREFHDPKTYRPDRSDLRHMTFGFGPHRCLGSHLARREFTVALNAWFNRVPLFSVKPGTSPVTRGGPVFSMQELHLVWR